MWGFRIKVRKRKPERKRKFPATNGVQTNHHIHTISDKTLSANNIQHAETSLNVHFAVHMCSYIGTVVTIFVASGGISGTGFTGVLLSVNDSYIRLITRIGSLPACAIGNTCIYPITPYTYNRSVNTLGSIACIPINKITSFVHNAV